MPEAVGRRVGEPADRADHGAVVGQRLAHAHEHDVGDPTGAAGHLAAGQRPGPGDDLLDDLGGRHVALQAALAGGAERAGHPAPGLGGDAHGDPVGVAHQHRLDQRAVERAATASCGWCRRRPPACARGHQRRQQRRHQLLAPGGGQVGHLCRVVDSAGRSSGGTAAGPGTPAAPVGDSTAARSAAVEVGQVPRRLGPTARLVEDQGEGGVLAHAPERTRSSARTRTCRPRRPRPRAHHDPEHHVAAEPPGLGEGDHAPAG